MKIVCFAVKESTNLRLRPSVSVIPTDDKFIWEFFQSNTRRIRYIKFESEDLARAIYSLNGQSINDLVASLNIEVEKVSVLVNTLIDWCLIELTETAQIINNSPFYRVLNFLADYIPSSELIKSFENIQNSNILVIGLGGVGSWIAHGLASSGVKNFILCDPDIVEIHNLNRSLFKVSEIGRLKTNVISDLIKNINSQAQVVEYNMLISEGSEIEDILEKHNKIDLVINAADYPNVDTTSEMIFKPLMRVKIPHIIAGGYNLHLSLIGPTILPGQSACFKCIEAGLNDLQADENLSKLKKLHRQNRNIGNLAPLAAISSSFTINEAIRVVAGDERLKPKMVNKRGEFNFRTSKLHYTEFSKASDCIWCGEKSTI